MRDWIVRSLVVPALSLVLCAGCQSAKIAGASVARPLGPFDAAVVELFDVSKTNWLGDQGEHTPAEIQGALRAELMARLADGGVAVVDQSGGAAVVVRGVIDMVDAGSGSTRVWVGFGAGQSKLTCRAWIHEAGSADPSVTLSIQGGSHGRAGLLAASYMSIADARDAGEQIATYLLKARGR